MGKPTPLRKPWRSGNHSEEGTSDLRPSTRWRSVMILSACMLSARELSFMCAPMSC